MSVKFLLLAASALAPLVSAQAPAWGQCGGDGWTGATTCVAGSTCVSSNQWYSQCIPGAASASSASTTTKVSSSASKTAVASSSSTKTSSSTASSPAASSTMSAVLWASHYSGSVSTLTLSRSGSSYSLVSSSQTTCGSQPSWLTYDSGNKRLYCVDESSVAGTLSAYNVGAAGGLSQTAKITISNSGVHSTLYGGTNGNSFQAIAHYSSSQLSTFALPITSTSKALQSFKYTMAAKGPVPSRQEAPHPHMALLDPTGAFILVPDLGADIIRIYSIARTTGLLTSCANYTAAPGSGPRHGSFFVPNSGSTAGTILFVGNELTNSISSFAVTYTGSCLSLKLTKTEIPYPNGKVPAATTPNGVKVGEVRVAGNTVLTSNRADNSFGTNLDSIALFDVNASANAFTFRSLSSVFGSYPRTFAVNKAGDLVAVGNQNSATVVIVKRDPATGALGGALASVRVGATATDGNGGLSSVIWME